MMGRSGLRFVWSVVLLGGRSGRGGSLAHDAQFLELVVFGSRWASLPFEIRSGTLSYRTSAYVVYLR